MVENTLYNCPLEEIRKLYRNLPNAYLDNAAAPLFPSTIPYKAADLLCELSPIVNPHNNGELGCRLSNQIDEIRNQVLTLFNVDSTTHELIFCSNATAGIKIVGECMKNYGFYYSTDSHTSIIGLRELALFSHSFNNLTEELPDNLEQSVISWSLQSNFSGRRFPGFEWVNYAVQRGTVTLLDISSFCATEMPDLGEIGCDIAILSFYKIFGYPDLGALIVRKSPKVTKLFSEKPYYGGGTVAALTPSLKFMRRKTDCLASILEDGTLPVHTILCLRVAIEEHMRLFGDFTRIASHTKKLSEYCRENILSRFKEEVIMLESKNNGPIVSFIIPKIGHNEFQCIASANDVHVRTGTMCNIGAFLNEKCITRWSDDNIIQNYERLGKSCNDNVSFIDGQPTGVIRVSFGPYSSTEDVDALIEVIGKVLVDETNLHGGSNESEATVTLEEINIFPIKSCAKLSLTKSQLLETGLLNDRRFCIIDLSTNSVLSLKKCRRMALLKPEISEDGAVLSVEFNNNYRQRLGIPMDSNKWKVVAERENFLANMDKEAVEFFSAALERNCTIACNKKENTHATTKLKTLQKRNSSTFSNSSPLLIANSASSESLGVTDISVFRANIVVRSSTPWVEDTWKYLEINSSKISIIGKCKRCNMICVTSSGESDSYPYMQLCRFRKIDGRLYFGSHASLELSPEADYPVIEVGQKLKVRNDTSPNQHA